MGPRLITGASDDDPSGIGTYGQAGAQLGFGIGWTMLATFPLMAAIQEISARLLNPGGAFASRRGHWGMLFVKRSNMADRKIPTTQARSSWRGSATSDEPLANVQP